MAITSALVLFAVIWFMLLFIVLPLKITTQGEAKDVVPGTPQSAPAEAHLKRKVKIITLITLPLWAVTCAVIITGAITVDDFDLFHLLWRGFDPTAPG